MRIGFDAKRAFKNKSGLGNYSRDLIRGLHDLYPNNEYYAFSPEKETELLDYRYYSNLIYPNVGSKAGKIYWRSFSVIKEIEKRKLDIYHGLTNELPFSLAKSNVKKVVTIHDLIFLEIPSMYPLVDRKIYLKKFSHACNIADVIVATSENTKNDIIKHFGVDENKVKVVYQSCNKNFQRKASLSQINDVRKKYKLPDKYVLNVGTIEQRKNLLNLVKAIYYFDLDIKLVVVGRKTPYYKEVKSYIDSHNLNDKVIFLSNVSNEDLPIIYQNSLAFIYPSLYEGFGIPIIEAFNSGVPVITSDKGSPAEIAGEAAILVDALNSKSIGVALKSVIDSSELRDNLIHSGKERAKLFDNEIVINNMMKVYKGL